MVTEIHTWRVKNYPWLQKRGCFKPTYHQKKYVFSRNNQATFNYYQFQYLKNQVTSLFGKIINFSLRLRFHFSPVYIIIISTSPSLLLTSFWHRIGYSNSCNYFCIQKEVPLFEINTFGFVPFLIQISTIAMFYINWIEWLTFTINTVISISTHLLQRSAMRDPSPVCSSGSHATYLLPAFSNILPWISAI